MVSEGRPRGEVQSPRHASEMNWEAVRYIPNGTQIPCGPPPPLEPSSSVQMLAWDLQAYELLEAKQAMKWLGPPPPPVARPAWEGGLRLWS